MQGQIMWKHFESKSMLTAVSEGHTSQIDSTLKMSCHQNSSCSHQHRGPDTQNIVFQHRNGQLSPGFVTCSVAALVLGLDTTHT